jgi:hypothetical protein
LQRISQLLYSDLLDREGNDYEKSDTTLYPVSHLSSHPTLHVSTGHSLSLFNLATVRNELAVVYEAMANHPSSSVAPSLPLNALVILALIAIDRKLIDSRDFGQCMPVFQALGGEIKVLTPLLTTPGFSSTSTSKRTRVEISEPNIVKARKTQSSLFPAVMDVATDRVELVLDVTTLSWSSLLGPQGTPWITVSML